MDHDLAARYQTHLWEQVFLIIGFLLITYVPLQAAAIWAVRHPVWRIVAALPMLPMLPVIIIGMQPNSHGNGSLYGILLMLVYVPVMISLAMVLVVGLSIRATTTNSPNPDAKSTGKGPV